MKNLRRLCFVLVLTLAFSVPALAGDSHTPGAPAPGDSPSLGAADPTDPGDGHTPGLAVPSTDPGDSQTPGFAAMLGAILSLI